MTVGTGQVVHYHLSPCPPSWSPPPCSLSRWTSVNSSPLPGVSCTTLQRASTGHHCSRGWMTPRRLSRYVHSLPSRASPTLPSAATRGRLRHPSLMAVVVCTMRHALCTVHYALRGCVFRIHFQPLPQALHQRRRRALELLRGPFASAADADDDQALKSPTSLPVLQR